MTSVPVVSNLSDTSKFTDTSEGDLLDAVGTHARSRSPYRNPIKNVAAAYGKLEIELTKRGLIGPGNYDLVVGFGPVSDLIGFFAAVPWANRSASYFRDFLKILNSGAHTWTCKRTAAVPVLLSKRWHLSTKCGSTTRC